jgi:uncharacterized protein YbjT (DUF2867 family)
MIFVSGAPGNVGTELVRRLSARGEAVRVLVHRSADAERVQFPGIATIEGDLRDPSSFERGVAGADAVFVSSSVGSSIRAQVSLIDAAARTGARRIVKLSWIGASEQSFVRSFGRWHAEVERHLKESGVPYTILRASTFMQNYLPQIWSPATHAIYSAAGSGRVSLVDARDVAAVAVVCLTEPRHEGRTYEVTGPQALSHAETARIIADALGRDVRFVHVGADELVEHYHRAGWPERWAAELVAADEYQAEGFLDIVTDVVQRVGRKRPTTFEEFVRESLASLAEHRSA